VSILYRFQVIASYLSKVADLLVLSTFNLPNLLNWLRSYHVPPISEDGGRLLSWIFKVR